MRTILFSGMIIITIFVSSCSMQSIVIRQMEPIFQNSADALFAESDYELAKQALPANLKLIEGLLQSDPDNERLLLLAAQGYAGYAMGFLEDTEPRRARAIYLRARNYALRALSNQKDINWLEAPLVQIEENLQTIGGKALAALFWTGFSWAGYINLSLTDPQAIADLPRVQAVMKRVEDLDATYYHGAVYLFNGAIYGMKPKILGGDPQKAKFWFDKNLALTRGKFLLTYIYLARFYAANIMDEALFDEYLNKVLNFNQPDEKSLRLLNAIAREKAKRLQTMKDELF
ncbi:MAG TPA: hypothetical protein EYP36_12550 [Calditrichaeota bacterium]|nr:hypothetical protein [Calditrichota bacterium]